MSLRFYLHHLPSRGRTVGRFCDSATSDKSLIQQGLTEFESKLSAPLTKPTPVTSRGESHLLAEVSPKSLDPTDVARAPAVSRGERLARHLL